MPDPNCIFPSENHRNALAVLQYGLLQYSGFILLTGEIGSGKTTLVRFVLNRIEKAFRVAVIQNTNILPVDLIGMVLIEFDLPATGSKARDIESLNAFLIESYARRKRVLLIIDEAQNLGEEALEEVRMLTNLQSDRQALIQVMLVGQAGLLEKLAKPSMQQLAQRVAVNYHIQALSREEMARYIEFRITRAGGRPNIFTPEAVDLVFELAAGIPRTINMACHAALFYAFSEASPRVALSHVEKIGADRLSICFPAPGRAAAAPWSAATDDPHRRNRFLPRIEALETKVQELKLLTEAYQQRLQRMLLQSHRLLLQRIENGTQAAAGGAAGNRRRRGDAA